MCSSDGSDISSAHLSPESKAKHNQVLKQHHTLNAPFKGSGDLAEAGPAVRTVWHRSTHSSPDSQHQPLPRSSAITRRFPTTTCLAVIQYLKPSLGCQFPRLHQRPDYKLPAWSVQRQPPPRHAHPPALCPRAGHSPRGWEPPASCPTVLGWRGGCLLWEQDTQHSVGTNRSMIMKHWQRASPQSPPSPALLPAEEHH